MATLEDVLTAGPPAHDGFQITDKGGALWALRKLARIRQAQAEAKALAEAEIAKITAWLEGELRRTEDDARYFEGLLTAYHARVLQDDPKAKTIRLPGGALVCRAQPDKVEVVDEAAALAAAKAAGYTDLVRVREEIDKRALREHLKATGEVLPGVTVTPQPARFSVQVEEGGIADGA